MAQNPDNLSSGHTPRPPNSLAVPSVSEKKNYFLSFGVMVQAIKLFNVVRPPMSLTESVSSYKLWLILDFVYCIILWQLRFPGLTYTKTFVLLQVLWIINGAIFFGPGSGRRYESTVDYSDIWFEFDFPEYLNIFPALYWAKDPHFLGRHTVRMSAVNTARLNPESLPFCIMPAGKPVFVPIHVNDPHIVSLKYSFTPLSRGDKGYNPSESFDLTLKNLKTNERHRLREIKRLNRDTDELVVVQKEGSVVYIKAHKPGTIRLEHVLYSQNTEARILYPSEMSIVSCPRAQFSDVGSALDEIRCSGRDSDTQLMIDIFGVPPLNLKWSKAVNGRREEASLEGIERGVDLENPPRYRRYNGANGRRTSGYERYESARVPQELRIPLDVPLNIAGNHLYILLEVTDALGNTVKVGSGAATSSNSDVYDTKTIQSFKVLRRPAVAFEGCSAESPMHMLIDSETFLTISSNSSTTLDPTWEITLKYEPLIDPRATAQGIWLSPWERTFIAQGARKNIGIPVSGPGNYSIINVKGQWCNGDMLTPQRCEVVEQPLPTIDINWKPTQDCFGESGISASFTLSGVAPFIITYRVQYEDEPSEEFSEFIAGMEGEMNRRIERAGRYTLTFVRMSDTAYKYVELLGPRIEVIIPQRPTAAFISGLITLGSDRRVLTSCENETVAVDVQMEGIGPWNLEVKIGASGSYSVVRINQIRTSRKTLDIPIPRSSIASGAFEIDLVSIEDSRHCKQPIVTSGLLVQLRNIKPTAKFHGERIMTIHDQEPARLPLKLTGHPPWRIKYRRAEDSQNFLSAMLPTASSSIHATEPGTYEIVDVADSHCPGFVDLNASSYRVDWIPRPSATLTPETVMTYDVHNRSHILAPACQGAVEHVGVHLTGRPPFQIVYNIIQTTRYDRKLVYNPTFYSIGLLSFFQLQTSQVGRVFYEIPQIGDAEYPLAKHNDVVIPLSKRLIFEQQVFPHPSIQFKTQGGLSYRLHDPFISLDPRSSNGVILLDGIPPFQVQLSITHLQSRHMDTVTTNVLSNAWKIDLPSYTFRTIGRHLIKIESVADASKCVHILLKPASSSIFVDVDPTAMLVPENKGESFCVGDIARFSVEGSGPWKIGYRIDANSYVKEIKTSPFSIPQERPGEFVVTSITHRQVQRPIIPNFHYTVYPLPSALVGYGKDIEQDINDGDRAEITFTLIGSPPFTFTYRRSEVSRYKDGRPGKVLETHTVSHVTTNTYTIFASIEGTWEVISIADLHCQYPPKVSY